MAEKSGVENRVAINTTTFSWPEGYFLPHTFDQNLSCRLWLLLIHNMAQVEMVIAHLCWEESAILSQEADFCQGRHHCESVRATKPNRQGTSQQSYSNSYNVLKKPFHWSSLYIKGWNQVWHGFFQVSIIVCPCRHTTTNPTARDEFSTFQVLLNISICPWNM